MAVQPFTFDILSTVLLLIVLVGFMLVLSAIGSALGAFNAAVFLVAAFLVGVILYPFLAYYYGAFFYVGLFAYFYFLFSQLAPLGLLLYGSVAITAAVSITFLGEVSLVCGFLQGRLDRRKSALRFAKPQTT